LNDVGVGRLPALHRGVSAGATSSPRLGAAPRSPWTLQTSVFGEIGWMFMICSIVLYVKSQHDHRLSFAVYDIAPAPQHGQLMATRMFCFCSSSRSVRSSICLVCGSKRSCRDSEL